MIATGIATLRASTAISAGMAAPVEVHVKPMDYQSTKAKMEEFIDQCRPDGSRPKPTELARALMHPTREIEDPDA